MLAEKIKVMIGAAIQGIGTIASLWGTHNQNKKKEGYLEDYQNQQKDLIAGMNKDYSKQGSQISEWYNKNNIGYLDTAEAQGTITRLKDAMQEQNNQIASNSAMTGATNASVVAQKKAGQSTMGNAMNQLAGRGTQYKNQIDNQYFMRNQALQNFKNQINQAQSGLNGSTLSANNEMADNKIKSWQNFSGNLANIGGSVAGMGGKGLGGLLGNVGKGAAGTGSGGSFDLNGLLKNQNPGDYYL